MTYDTLSDPADILSVICRSKNQCGMFLLSTVQPNETALWIHNALPWLSDSDVQDLMFRNQKIILFPTRSSFEEALAASNTEFLTDVRVWRYINRVYMVACNEQGMVCNES